MDFLYVPTKYSSENYSSFVDSKTTNSVPGLSHSSDANSRCGTPRSFDHGRDLEPATTLSDVIWNPLPSFEDHLHLGSQTTQAIKRSSLGLFGARNSPPHGASEDRLLGTSFDSAMRELKHQTHSDAFSYVPMYEPLNWSLPPLQVLHRSRIHLTDSYDPSLQKRPTVDDWAEFSSSSGLTLRGAFNGYILGSLDSYTYPTHVHTNSRTSSASSTPNQGSSPIRYNPLSTHRDTTKGSATRSKGGDGGPVYQHVCSECSCKFARARDLTRHFRSHTGERPYECSGCNERFARVDARKRHWNSHPKCLAAHQNSNA